jgi:hypothetical protein
MTHFKLTDVLLSVTFVILCFVNVNVSAENASSTSFYKYQDPNSQLIVKFPIYFENPMLKDFAAKNITLDNENRCNLYPRCLLFGCCSAKLVDAVQESFNRQHHTSQAHKLYSCMYQNQSCNHQDPLSSRMSGFVLNGVTLTEKLLVQILVTLPVTPPHIYSQLQKNHSEEIRTLYLAQGDDRSKLPEWYSTMKDLIFLNYKNQSGGM